MNAQGSTVTAKRSPPPQPVIGSLTSNANSKTPGTTSLAESLATSLADYVCGNNQRKNINAAPPPLPQSTLPKSPPKPPKSAGANKHHTLRLVSAEQPNDRPTTKAKCVRVSQQPPVSRQIPMSAPRTVASTMSSAVADLASGMSIFSPANPSRTASNTGGGGGNSNINNHHSAPIISGTAAAVLALQSTSYDLVNAATAAVTTSEHSAPAIVSNPSSVESRGDARGGAVPNPLALPGAAVASPRGETFTSTSTTATGAHDSPRSATSATGTVTSPKFPTRYADGAPIIAGTAAAQMEAIATATAARITSLTVDGGMISEEAINAVASLGPLGESPYDQFGLGEESASSSAHTNMDAASHGFDVACASAMGWGNGSALQSSLPKMRGAFISRNNTPNKGNGNGGSAKALSWVDHGSAGGYNNNAGVHASNYPTSHAMSDEGSPPAYHHQVSMVSAPASAQHLAGQSAASMMASGTMEQSAEGGMDILAEIICHAPPMSVPTNVLQGSSSSANNINASYPQHHSSNATQLYQDTYHHQGSQQSAQHHQEQVSNNQESLMLSPNTMAKRVSAIPSYQEIYQEMGLSPRTQHGEQQQKSLGHSGAQHHYSVSSYSIEEVEVDPSKSSGDASNMSSNGNTPLTMSHHYNHRPPTTRFGHASREDVEEGKELYTRKDLMHLAGHFGENKDVHGNMKEGCDSICVGNLEKDLREGDGLVWFFYSTDRSNGGGALCQSYHKKRPIRVFRSSLCGRYSPPFLDMEDDEEGDSDVGYRYDGLYMVCAVWDVNGRETESFPVLGKDGWQTYFFTRVPKKPLDKDKMEPGMQYNAMGLQELWSTIQKTKGVRKPKKFEIPQPAVKLHAMKRVAIMGAFKDRKCAGWKRPDPPVAPPPAPKPQPPPRIKSPKTVPIEKPQPKPKEPIFDSDSSSSSSSEEDEPEIVPQLKIVVHHAKKEKVKVDDSDSDLLHPKHDVPLSAQTPAKVHTPRPRMNSVTLSTVKRLPAAAHEDSSSDSETESSTTVSSTVVSQKQKLIQQNKRARKPSPKRAQLLNNIDFIPKRATAAKAEAANRNMLGSHRTYNKRKSTETAAAPAPAKPKSKPPPPARVSGRKKAKVQQYDESSASSEEEEEEEPDVVDQSVITVGSRVLVTYKGSLFKSTIRKRRFKNESHDFLIHYDGNKRTNVHWVSLDRIKEILEINVKATPSKNTLPVVGKKQTAAASAARRKGGNGTKRKAESQMPRQEILQKSHQNEHEDAPTKQGASSRSDDEKKMLSKEALPSNTNGVTESHVKKTHLSDNDKEVNPMTDAWKISVLKADSNQELGNKKVATQHDDQVDGKESNADQSKLQVTKEATEPCPVEKEEKTSLTGESEKSSVSENHDMENDNEISVLTTRAEVVHEEVEEDDSPSDWVTDILTGDIQESPSATTDSKSVSLEIHTAKKALDDQKLEIVDTEGAGSVSGVNDDVHKKPSSKGNFKTTTATSAAARKPRTTVVSDVCAATELAPAEKEETSSSNPKDPLAVLAGEAGSDSGDLGSEKDSDENSTSSSGKVKQEQSVSEPTSRLKFPLGGQVYVEYRQIFYSSTIIKTRRKRSAIEYLVHYEGYKKSSNRWVKVNSLHDVNAATTQRFEEQRLIPPEILYESQPPHFSMTTRRNKSTSEIIVPPSLENAIHSVTEAPKKSEAPNKEAPKKESSKKAPPRRMRSEASDSALDALESGVVFLPGSMVFGEWSGALYLAKMLKKRYTGDRMEYLISYDGYKHHDAWVSIHKIYEVNPKTKRVFKRLSEFFNGDATDEKLKRRAPPGPRRRETRKKAQDYDDIVSHSSAAQTPSLRNNVDIAQPPPRASSRAQPSQPGQGPVSTLDMEGIESGVEFLPGSTIFAEYKGGLCLAKMLKKRGKGDYMEYFIQYTGLKKSEEVWMPITLIYEINPQTKRMFRKLSKK